MTVCREERNVSAWVRDFLCVKQMGGRGARTPEAGGRERCRKRVE